MYPYLIIYASWAGLAFFARARRHSKVLALLFALFLVVFAGTRVEVGCDYVAYLLRYGSLYDSLGWGQAMRMGEGGFNWLNKALIELGRPYSSLLFVCSLVYVACLYRFSLLATRPLSLMVTAFPVLVLQLAMSGLRQALAGGLLMLAYAAFVERRRGWVFGWVLLASLFHTSAIVFLPMAFLLGRTVSAKQLLVALLLAGPIVAWLIGERLGIYSDRYFEQIYGENEAAGAWLRYAIAALPFLLFEWKRKLVKDAFPDLFPLIRLFSFISLAMVAMGFVSTVALHRTVYYVLPVSLLALLCVTEAVFSRRSTRFASLLPFLAYGLYISVWFLLSEHSRMCYVPYQSWLLQ